MHAPGRKPHHTFRVHVMAQHLHHRLGFQWISCSWSVSSSALPRPSPRVTISEKQNSPRAHADHPLALSGCSCLLHGKSGQGGQPTPFLDSCICPAHHLDTSTTALLLSFLPTQENAMLSLFKPLHFDSLSQHLDIPGLFSVSYLYIHQ